MKTTTEEDYKNRILRVLVHIQAHLDHALDLEELASLAYFSPYHFHRVFRGMVGEAVKEHVRRLRLERAAHQLKTTGRPITHIAFDAGYETHEAFTRAFRAMFDAPPSRFRASRRCVPVRGGPAGVRFAPEGTIDGFQPLQSEVKAMNVQVKEMRPQRVAFMRHVGPFEQVGATWQQFMAWAASRGLFGAMGGALALVHDDPEITPPDRLRYDVCIPVADEFQPEAEVGVQEIAGGPYAVTRHHGPYDRLGETYAVLLGQWLPANNREPKHGPCLEVYLNNPQQTAPEDLLTDVHVPLKPASE
ncbi:MAG: GyrI-like domain-containing protein [Phycisphaerae bacterium]